VAARSIRPQMDQLKQKYQKKFRKAEANLRKLKQDLQRERAILPEGYAERLKAFQLRVRKTEREIQTVNRMIDRAFGNSMQKINQTLRDITMEVAQERLLQFVIPKRGLIFYDKQFDITKAVSERLNKRLPNVVVTMPKLRQIPAKN
ncbi:MAG: OmpH family outer membrane protein, partial [Alphaproteobacteria bacterium]